MPGLVVVDLRRTKVGRGEDIQYAVDTVAVTLLDANQAFIGILQQRHRRLDITQRGLRVEDFNDGMILDPGEQTDDVLVRDGVHYTTLAQHSRRA